MHNRLLDTFLITAGESSFSKAAEKLYITPSAVSQKMSEFESYLGVKLFHRDSRGITLTDAGKLLKREGTDYIEKGKDIRRQLLKLENPGNTLNIATSLEEKCRVIFDIWMDYSAEDTGDRISITTIPPDKTIPDDADIVESVRDGSPWQKHWNFFQAGSTPLCIAVDRRSPLVDKEMLKVSDFVSSPVVIIDRFTGVPSAEKACRYISDAGGSVINRPDITANTVWELSDNHYGLLCPAVWHDVVFDVVLKEVDWDLSLEYGLFYRVNCSAVTKRVIDFASRSCSGKDYLARYK